MICLHCFSNEYSNERTGGFPVGLANHMMHYREKQKTVGFKFLSETRSIHHWEENVSVYNGLETILTIRCAHFKVLNSCISTTECN